MTSSALTEAARDLEGYLQQKVAFYLRVGWVREDTGDSLVVYYDQRESLPSGLIPRLHRGVSVRSQASLPPGVAPPEDPFPYSWMVM